MNSNRLILCLALLASLPGHWLSAQNPFGAPANAAQAPASQPAAQPPGANPFGAPVGQAAGAAKQPAANQPGAAGRRGAPAVVETDLAVLAIRDSNPTTPSELLRAIQSMRRLERPALALDYLKKLLEGNLNSDALVGMHDQFGTGFFKDLAEEPKLKPESEKLYADVVEAAETHYRDVSRIDGVIRQLSSESKSQQLSALLDLKRVGRLAVERMLAALADGSRDTEHTSIRKALVAMKDLAIEPCVGALETDDPGLTIQVMHVLGRLRAARSMPFLLRPMFMAKDERVRAQAADSLKRIVGELPNRSQAEAYLYQRLQAHRRGLVPVEPDVNGQVRLWHGDLKSIQYPTHVAAQLLAAQVADELLALDPENQRYRQAYLLAQLASTKLMNGLDRPLADFDPEVQQINQRFKGAEVETALEKALQEKDIPAAVGAAQILGHIGTPELVYSSAGRLRTLTAATAFGDPRVQFAATEAILSLDPAEGFPGSSNVVASLSRVIMNGGTQRVVIGHPVLKRLEDLRGFIAEAGFETEMSRNGRGLFVAATRNPDVELILMSDRLAFPRAIEVHQALRRDPGTAGTPIAVIAAPDDVLLNEQLYQEDPLTTVIVEPHSAASVKSLIDKLQSSPVNGTVGFENRVAQARRALIWVGRLAESPDKYSFYNLRRLESAAIQALRNPMLSDRAAHFLGLLGTPAAQQALVDLASAHGEALPLRQAAVEAFRRAIQRRRVLLTTVSIQRQYDRYNDTAQLDRETQQVMGSILDAIEGPQKEKQVTDK